MSENGGQKFSGYDRRVRNTRIFVEMEIIHMVISKRTKRANDASFECEIKYLISPSVLCLNIADACN
jgi:hypothetical protein